MNKTGGLVGADEKTSGASMNKPGGFFFGGRRGQLLFTPPTMNKSVMIN